MVETINFYWDLYNKVGEKYAFFAYNGGERAANWKKRGIKSNSSLIKNVTVYDKAVRSNVEKYTKELASYKKEARSLHIAELKKEFHELGLKSFQARYKDNKSNLENRVSTNIIIMFHIQSSCIAYIKREDFLSYEFS